MSKKFKNILIILVALIASLTLAHFVFAQDLGVDYVAPLNLSNSDPREAAVGVTALLMTFLGIIATIVVIYGGFLWVTSAGDPQKIDKAKKVLIGGVIGLVLVLSAYIIVSFIINNIGDALEPGQTCEPACTGNTSCCTKGGTDECCISGQFCCGSGIGCSNDPCGSIGGTDDSFRITKTIPRDGTTGIIRNVAVKVSFNQPVVLPADLVEAQTILNNNFKINKIADIDPVTEVETSVGPITIAGEDVIISESRKNISFKAAADCLDEKNTPNCFPGWSKFQVTIDGSSEIVAAGPQNLDCSGANCVFVFSTNDLIDTGPPTAGIVPTQMCWDDPAIPDDLGLDANIVGGWGRDDISIAEIRFYESRILNELPYDGTGNKYQYVEHFYNTSLLSVDSIYTFEVQADDMVGDMASDSFDATLRVGHCCNEVLDADEEEVDCGGNECDSCVTKDPIIYWFSPDNGAPGNWITIGGRNFGNTPGDVYFWNGTDMSEQASFPNSVNSACTNDWQDDQIVVIVPPGTEDGPVRVVRADDKEDTTDNTNGPAFDFYRNDITRPGICLAAPDNGYFDDEFNLQGTGFSGTARSVNFGNETSNIIANNINFSSNISASSTVPNIKKGKISVFVEVDGESSNYLKFNVLYDASSQPIIDYIDPASGPRGQYITIYGSNFKHRTPSSRVEFLHQASGATVDADGLDFPPECQDRWWRDNYIVVKVPDVAVLDTTYEVRITNRDNQTSDPEDFDVTTGSPGPGLCLLDPYNGPIKTEVDVYGDNFGGSPGFVRFYNNINSSITDWANQIIDTSVPGGAETGSVRASNGSELSNPLPFTVGNCNDDSQCDVSGGDVCCGGGTYWSGICRQASDCSINPAGLSGYGWSFSTASSGPISCASDQTVCGSGPTAVCCAETLGCENEDTDPVGKCFNCEAGVQDQCGDLSCCNEPCLEDADIFGSYCPTCAGYSKNQCSLAQFCPNSAGQCSPYEGETQADVGDCNDAACDGLGACDASCEYNTTIDKCTNNISCSASRQITNVDGNLVTANCQATSTSLIGRWEIKTAMSCPSGWAKPSLNSNVCVEIGSTCNLCDSGFTCDEDGSICVIDRNVCPTGASCVAGECLSDTEAECECCCRIGFEEEDCCPQLDCTGQCGSDRTTSSGTYGECSGCWVDADNSGSPSAGDQDASDAACNCLGTSGKACVLDDPLYPEGVCRDCAGLATSTDCSLHDTVCCSDNRSGDKCRGGAGEFDIITDDDPNLAYCPYYSCAGTDPDSCNTTASTTGTFRNEQACIEACDYETPDKPGERCVATTTPEDLICDLTFDCGSVDYSCLPLGGPDCGRCCCDPSDPPQVNAFGLECYPDKSPCDGASRGLYCGCENDIECGNTDTTACGSDPDRCCSGRPIVDRDSVEPPDEFPDPGSGNGTVCRNVMIKADFNEIMDLSSFSGNVIVVGDYNQEPCPEGTNYLALGGKSLQKRNIFQISYLNFKNTMYQILSDVLPSHYARAYTDASSGRNYCAITGSVNGFHDPDDFSTLNFSPSRLLDPDRLYYVIIKGDKDLADDKNEGVLNQLMISMNESAVSGQAHTFNGINYENSYIWSFRTLSDQTQNKGVCLIDHVDMKPSSYLFKTTKDAINFEIDGDQNADSFDTVRDSDKVFEARAMSKDNQELAPITGIYDWDWNWSGSIDNPSIADFDVVDPFATDGQQRLVEAQPTATEGSTFIRPAIDMNNDNSFFTGDGIKGVAEIYLFICENPWPPIKAGEWHPWRDDTEGMPPVADCVEGTCINTNYEIYYCRDDGKVGTIDDLPAIKSADTIIRGQTDYIFKEAYFFREVRPGGTSALTANNTTTATSGKSAYLEWDPVGADGYKIYWGKASGNYSDYEDVKGVTNYTISNLDNGTTYYFNLTSYYVSAAESDFYGEVELLVEDISQPEIVTLSTTTPGDGEVMLEWVANTDDTESYEVNYGVDGPNSRIYGFSEDIGSDTAVIIAGLTNGQEYYFAIRAVDASENKSSNYSNEMSVKPFARPTNLTVRVDGSNDVNLSWGLNGDGVNQRVEQGTVSGTYPVSYNIGGTETTYTVTTLSSSTKYYFRVTSYDGSFTASSDEVNITTHP